MVYYMTQRPPMIGAMPKEGLVDWVAFDDDGRRVFCEKIGCEAYAKLNYSRELTEQEVNDYELIPETRTVTLTTAEMQTLSQLVYRTALDASANVGDELYGIWKKLREA